MSSKMNWACAECGMASGRKESVLRHINNPTIHNGNAIPVPFVQYLAGLARGAYSHNIQNPFKAISAHRSPHLDKRQIDRSFLDTLHMRVREKTIDKIADEIVNHTPSSPPTPKISYPFQRSFQRSSFNFPGENIFGIGGYICKECLLLKPKIFAFANGSVDGSTQSVVYPTQFCLGSRNFGSPQEKMQYIRHNEINGFPTVLHTWIKRIWSMGHIMKLISFQIHGVNRSKSEMDAFNLAGPKVSNSVSSHSNPYVESNGKMVRVMVEQWDLTSLRKSITLPYDDFNLIHLSAILSVENHPSIRSKKVSNASILKAIERSEQLITSEEDLLSFLSYAKYNTFGFFHIGNESHLVMLIPEEYTSDRSYSCQVSANS
jgi:hypothetical protein